jgi:hypothetical protein
MYARSLPPPASILSDIGGSIVVIYVGGGNLGAFVQEVHRSTRQVPRNSRTAPIVGLSCPRSAHLHSEAAVGHLVGKTGKGFGKNMACFSLV